jgi:peptidoglycan/xylan/chitin deacetylase (PgdA/CDA1 family)
VKRVTKFLISAAFFGVCWIRDAILALFGYRPTQCVILYYHSVPESQQARFARQMDLLLESAEPLRGNHKLPLVPGGRYAVVTFDDAFRNILHTALPAMRSRKIPATIFVTTGLLGKSWHDSSAQSDADREVMSEQELRQIPAERVEIGSHSLTHPRMTQLTSSEAILELGESRQVLERMLERPILLFSFPYGEFNNAIVDWAREAGYDRVFTVLPQLALSNPKEFVSPRVRVDPTDWQLEFRLKLLGAYRWLPMAFAIKRRLLMKRPESGIPQQISAAE